MNAKKTTISSVVVVVGKRGRLALAIVDFDGFCVGIGVHLVSVDGNGGRSRSVNFLG